jgi:hypothetical protein
MLNLIIILLMLLPVASVALLFTTKSDQLRRGYLAHLSLTLLIVMMVHLLLNWILNTQFPRNSSEWLFEGTGAPVLSFFFSNMWAAAAYALLLGVAGYFANRHAIHRTRARVDAANR